MVFAYEFPHLKSHDGLLSMIMNGLKPDFVIAAPHENLPNDSASKFRVSLRGLDFVKVEDICRSFKIPFLVSKHNSEEVVNLLKEFKPRLGVILGARILSKSVIETFSMGIINSHPGMLPWNRGLDNIKWAVYDHLPQGITFHLIDYRVDVGKLISQVICEVYPDDSWQDIFIRLMNIQTQRLPAILNDLPRHFEKLTSLSTGKYNKQMNYQQEEEVICMFDRYKNNYQHVIEQWSSQSP